ncbi:hypothetical protein SAMN05444274_105287 [Mariniphaga anaerophila]|uniref:Collagen triple helix repeat-containing protein n=1 Tax=Mariniphaga anaerophila TaxID=1484053 RepID=A0A1M5BT77_9BACT|nr:hypothetical protein [Mariniphaga anaerophila]SHF45477.1 hypothetical protein SAMN05444274_105287 [Mariniphaga anaerophila]
MKTITGIFLVFALGLLASCVGEPGPPGRDGYDGLNGQDGESFFGSVFEIEGDFTSENNYTLYFKFPSDITVYDTDVALVYILWGQEENEYGDLLDVWRLLPQTVVLENEDPETGILTSSVLQYNYDYTYEDVKVFLEGTIDFGSLLPAEALGQVFRIVVFPADFLAKKSFDANDYNMVIKSLNVKPNFVQKIDLANQIEISSPK